MSSKILFVFEGPRAEGQIKDNLTQYFVNENSNVHCAYCSDIYQLYNKIHSDPDLDTFFLLKERQQNKISLSKYSRDDFAEIYMFFDFDGHATNAEDDKIEELLSFFNEETETGKLYISYPMVEAIKHFSCEVDFKNLKVEARKNIKYKKIVNDICDPKFKNLTQLTLDDWVQLLLIHVQKMNYIVNDTFTIPNDLISQNIIFLNQRKKYLEIDNTISVLSAFPIFILDYYGIKKFHSIISV